MSPLRRGGITIGKIAPKTKQRYLRIDDIEQ
jgi:hypothetical protein